jgi:phenylacetate-CoA ligase
MLRERIARTLLRSRLPGLDQLAAIYDRTFDPAAVARLQTDRFNRHWQRASREVPFYSEWRREHCLPDRIANIDELADFPVLTKRGLSERRALVARTPGVERHTLTGGTSGISTAFPMNAGDARTAWTNTHLGRLWNGIAPGERLFMIWGHSHLFAGRGAWIKQLRRRAKDWAANIDRMSAYNLSDRELDKIAAGIRATRPRYVIGYGSCLAQLAHHLHDAGRDLSSVGVRRVVNTSETMPPSDAPHLAAAFGCPVINEYGMAEAGVIGYSVGGLYPVRVFWHDFAVRLKDRRILVTTLGDRCFPLIQYDTEDISDDAMPPTGSVLEMRSLMGKARDIFSLRDAAGCSHDVSVVLFDHVLKQVPELRSLHYTLRADGGLRIDYTAEGPPLAEATLQVRFADGLAQEGIAICPESAQFHRLDTPLQTVAGKRVTLMRERT